MLNNNPFLQSLVRKCQLQPGRVIFPEGDDPRVVEAVHMLFKWSAVREVKLISTTNSGHLVNHNTRIQTINPNDHFLIKLTRNAYEAFLSKKQKTIQAEVLNRISESPLYQAGALLEGGEGDCVVAGCRETTADVIRAAISTVGLASGIRTVSGSFIMNRYTEQKDETYIFADCGVVIEPTIEQLADIATGSIATFRKITGNTPVVAFLSFSTKGSADHPAAKKMQAASDLFRKQNPGVECDGELQFDAAFIAEVGLRKAPGSPVPGRANCFIFPDLNAGNIAYKISQRLGNFGAYGPILQGVAKPYSDLSRGASAEDIAISALINILRSR